ncbi:MAG: hypothetical protein ABFC62_01525 [Clostridiaceae bacterium]|nr:hypothetical protein [Eubacteriales bacterium]
MEPASHKNGIHAQRLLSLQRDNGAWGHFHSLSQNSGAALTTEQALRRLERLGFTQDDPAIQAALSYMHACLAGETELPDRREKTHDWDRFTRTMLAAWICRFTEGDALANEIAAQWGKTVSAAYESGRYDHGAYLAAYAETFRAKPYGGRLSDFTAFYELSLLSSTLDRRVEQAFFEDVLNRPTGIYYLYGGALTRPPADFCTKEASRYLAAVELMLEYESPVCRALLSPAAAWLKMHRGADGLWDMGAKARDSIYFPLSDSWRSAADRKRDCTERLARALERLEG